LENGENGLGDEGADGGNAPPRPWDPPDIVCRVAGHIGAAILALGVGRGWLNCEGVCHVIFSESG